MLEKSLKQLGLGDYEALVYSMLLENSPAGATLLAKKSNLSRSSVYTTLSSLISKGLVATTYKNEIKQFIAQGHSSLKQLVKKEEKIIKKKLKILDDIKSNLDILVKKNINIPQIIFFEGQEGLKEIYMSMMRQSHENETMYILRDEFIWHPEWQFVFEPDWHDRMKKIKTEKNIKTNLLINDSMIEKQKRTFYNSRQRLKFRFLTKGNSIKHFAVYIIGDIISILSMENNNLVGIKINNQHISDNFKKIFSVLWEK